MTAAPLNRTVMWLTRRQLFAKQRLIVVLTLFSVPALIALIYRASAGESPDAIGFVTTVSSDVIISVLMPIIALVFGTSAFGGEVDDGTLIYLIAKPVPRWTLALSKYVVALAATLAITIPSFFVVWALTSGSIPYQVPVGYAVGAVVGSGLYCAIFVTLGITSRRALALGLLYIIAFENVLSRNIAGAKSLSVREFSMAVCKWTVGHAAPFTVPTVSMATVWTMGTIFLVVALGMGITRLLRYEVAERL
jgi:ABC-2 type transport system permease protein